MYWKGVLVASFSAITLASSFFKKGAKASLKDSRGKQGAEQEGNSDEGDCVFYFISSFNQRHKGRQRRDQLKRIDLCYLMESEFGIWLQRSFKMSHWND